MMLIILSDGNTYDTATVAQDYRDLAAGETPNPTQYQYKEFKPETVASWELGYKGIIDNKLFIDIYGFYAQYTDFIGLTVLIKNPFPTDIYLDLFKMRFNTFGIYTNSSNKVNTVGAGIESSIYFAQRIFCWW